MSGCRGLQEVPEPVSKLSHLEDVICDEETSHLWKHIRTNVSNVKINAIEKDRIGSFMDIFREISSIDNMQVGSPAGWPKLDVFDKHNDGCPATTACSLPLPNRNMPKKEKAQVLNLQVIVASDGLFVGFYIGVLKLRC
ncbi:hypothetical protein Tco_0396879 [Tanacetum coccineum]